MADLVTLLELKAIMGIDPADTSKDDALNQAIKNASAAVRAYAERAFGAPEVNEARDYVYRYDGWLEIDDATAVSSVVLDGVTLDPAYDYSIGPERPVTPDAPRVYTWIELAPGFVQSPEMGFKRNLDTLHLFGTRRRFAVVTVTGTFGWPAGAVPASVKQAALWTAVEFVVLPEPFNQVTMGTYQATQPDAMAEAIPPRAKELLNPFRRGMT